MTRDCGTARHGTNSSFYIFIPHSAFIIPHSALIDRTTNGEVELAVVVASGAIHVVEAIAPIEAQQTEHR